MHLQVKQRRELSQTNNILFLDNARSIKICQQQILFLEILFAWLISTTFYVLLILATSVYVIIV